MTTGTTTIEQDALQVSALANRFSSVLRRWLTTEQMKEVVKRNDALAVHPDKRMRDCCASHDFCDANMAMDQAFREVFKRELLPDDAEGMADADLDMFNAAWTLAKRRRFEVI